MKKLFPFMLLAIISFNCQKGPGTSGTTTTTLPTITTTAVTSITTTTATGGGNISSDGGAAITARGVCWSSTPNPVVTGSHSTDGNGTGTFTSAITALGSATVYYVRAYATNSVGTAYGNELTLTTLTPDIYIAGIGNSSGTNVATTWKNGINTFLTTGPNFSHANSLFVKDNDVYVGGYVSNGTKTIATIWKNGTANYLSNGAVNYYINGIFVSDNNDVYAVGYSDSLYSTGATLAVARYWKNGNLVNIGPLAAYSGFYAVALSGADLYIAGFTFNGSRVVATIWKNGVPAYLSDGTISAYTSNLFINGADVYVTGKQALGSNYIPQLWKNGNIVNLITPGTYGQATNVVVNNDSVYVAGSTFNGTNDVATVWKNGVPGYLQSGPNKNSYATSIKVIGNDVFVCGDEVGTGARFWKNGVGVTLASSVSSSQANSIFLK